MIDRDDVEDMLDDAGDATKHVVKKVRQRMTTTPPWMQVMAAIGFIAIGAIVVPALWGMVAEAPNIRRYLRINRM